jgi:glycosyltransferase involved in cell wall biosynthesis
VSLGIANCVTFVGDVPHHELPALYRAADVFVQSSLHEGQGMALLEAGACACALAGTRVGILADLALRDAAVPSPPGDPLALAQAMLDAWTMRAELGARAARLVRDELNLSATVERLEQVYARLSPAPGGLRSHLADREMPLAP